MYMRAHACVVTSLWADITETSIFTVTFQESDGFSEQIGHWCKNKASHISLIWKGVSVFELVCLITKIQSKNHRYK